MSRQTRATTSRTVFLLTLVVGVIGLGCSSQGEAKESKSAIPEISSEEQLTKLIESSPNRLLVFDLYADWCGPCRMLSPILEKVAREHGDKADFYKINVDKQQAIAAAFGVRGIPYVVFVKNKTGVYALNGLQPKAAYVRAIERFSETELQDLNDRPDGELVDAVRVIRLTTATNLGNIYVYRGENVKLIVDTLEYDYSIHIPEYDISNQGSAGETLEVAFKATEAGVFPIYCNGKCPAGDGAQFGQIVVMNYTGDKEGEFNELGATETMSFLDANDALVLDVRTPNEYFGGHLPGAKLIPLRQLEGRLSEIESHADKDVVVYCRTGNRSTVAAQILIRNGFKRIHHLRPGIVGWQKAGHPVVKD